MERLTKLLGKISLMSNHLGKLVFTACDIFKKQEEFKKITKNPLPISEA